MWSVEQSSPIHRVSDVEGMVIRAISRDSPSVNKEGVGSPSLHYQLWDDGVIDIPGNTPARLTYEIKTFTVNNFCLNTYRALYTDNA